MPNYKEMYLTLMRETVRSVRILIEAQKRCEDLYLEDEWPNVRLFPPQEHAEKE